MARSKGGENLYQSLLRKIFFDRYKKGSKHVEFERNDLVLAATSLGISLPKNLGDVLYSARYRTALPADIIATQPKGKEWIIEGTGIGSYVFKLTQVNRIVPNASLVTIKIPDATPEIITAYALSDEQALLAKVRCNRLLDVFLGITSYSLQNHLRTTVKGIGQIEIDEIYVGVDRQGRQFVLPVQAKGGNDQLGVVQAKQDIECCKQKFPTLICRPIATQFMADNSIAIFELTLERDKVKVVEERHYQLVPASHISTADLLSYSLRV